MPTLPAKLLLGFPLCASTLFCASVCPPRMLQVSLHTWEPLSLCPGPSLARHDAPLWLMPTPIGLRPWCPPEPGTPLWLREHETL